jgi:hypothetical protein
MQTISQLVESPIDLIEDAHKTFIEEEKDMRDTEL